jgi:hypothetical protein
MWRILATKTSWSTVRGCERTLGSGEGCRLASKREREERREWRRCSGLRGREARVAEKQQ